MTTPQIIATVIAVLFIIAVIVAVIVAWSANDDWNARGYEMDDKDPYAEGLEAAESGLSSATCPYEYDTPDGDEWLKGYQDGGGDD